MRKNKKGLSYVIVLLLFAICIFLTFNKHRKSGYFTYHGEIWSDKAGYYVYLPSAIIYDFNANLFPQAIDTLTGYGFSLEQNSGKVLTKYTYGVSLMQLPFFCLAHYFAPIIGQTQDGFSAIYHWSINVSAVFYLFLGGIFLYKFLRTSFNKGSTLIVIFYLFLGSNLYYYSIDETGMSHVYSFALFCLFLYVCNKSNYLKDSSPIQNFLIGILMGMILLLRPTNILLFSILLFFDIHSFSSISARLRAILTLKTITPLALGSILIILPQLFYWKYASGSYLYYSYDNEGFNWLDPQLIKVWFEPENGLFTYHPLYFILITSLAVMIRKNVKNGLFLMLFFFLISYVFSSWWAWNFGCAFGSRSFVEYLAIFSIPLAYAIENIQKKKMLYRLSFGILLLGLMAFNLKMVYSYDGCFLPTKAWDWDRYIELSLSPTK